MGRRELKATGSNPDIFGHEKPKRSRKRQRGDVSPPGVTPGVAKKISQSLGFVQPSPPPQQSSLEPGDDKWEDIPEEMNDFQGINNGESSVIDSSGNQYAQYQKELRRAEARAKRAKKWLAHENKIIAMYLNLQNRTLNWTTEHSYVNDEIKCACLPENCRQSQLETQVTACKATDAVAVGIKHIAVLYDIGCHLGAHIAKNYPSELNSPVASQTYTKCDEAQPGHMYSDAFLREQWDSEREAYASKKVAMQKQELELGRLLSLQDKQKALLLRVAQTPEQSIARVLESERLREEIVKQAEKVGTAEVFHTSTEQEDFLKLWYSKHEVALYYIALNEEKRPLQQSRADGHHSNIGQRGKTSVLLALRKRAAQLRKKVDTYRTRRAEYQAKYPAQQLPEDIDYNALNEIKADHPFWNDSIFTKLQDPWATDPKTRDGMRQLAYIDRAQEELRRLGWETYLKFSLRHAPKLATKN
ncbi:uncharacterized protein MELLADRAFT_109971 [Melampsora larici-populina 98AG31]|uniref:CxC1-like cysteine cluster associated with KDZ transposases domain-containing protein n=1 Tax=Melampsora larici-populina (strain 98AG31 / pathotype 3-4-7) TaxID=747676 RepID=F4RY81_MELLP|nr:uncharacterized protein MELLADRAFT_109971 [Melampsora larici-populina 98AG31]EGG02631.1 hypothetical protein MELLADRAFT_109971 [Melampsora larici-populina 98AG31]